MAHAADAHPDAHASWQFYTVVGAILTVITAVEVAVFYIPPLAPILVPTLLLLSIGKFVGVVAYYMHLKFDHGLYTFLFCSGLALAIFEVLALMVLSHVNPGMVPPRQPVRAQLVAAVPMTTLSAEELEAVLAGLPDEPAQASIDAGAEIYPTAVCVGCHGVDRLGVPNMGPNLADATWLNNDGSYKGIVGTILNGVPEPQEHANVMPPRGGAASLTDEQVAQLAAYIYSGSR